MSLMIGLTNNKYYYTNRILEKTMKTNFIRKLTEAAISTTDLALNVESMSEAIQSMIEKITNIKTKDLALLVKKIKYDNEISKADEFNQNIGGKLDQLIQSMTEIKGEIDNVTVSMLNGDENMGSDEGSLDDGMSDIDSDFGEFNLDDMDSEEGDMGDIEDIDSGIEPMSRESK
jgi:predicted transcriptional regulator